VVSGLALAGASAISHDLYARVIKKGTATSAQEMKVTRLASVGLGITAILLGIAFKDQNVLFLVALAFGVASSVNFPILILSMYWKGLTRGALWGGIAGLVSSVGLVVLSPTVWVKILGNKAAIFPYDHPAIVSMTLAFFVTWLLSVTDKSPRAAKEAEAFEEQYIRAQTGLGASGARDH
jgi:cation/acetate symporter